MWCITKHELCLLSLPMVMLSEPSQGDPPAALHINVLEFLALTINIWMALAQCEQDDPHHQWTHISNFFMDNTSTLSWMQYAGQAKTPHTRHLAQFMQALLTFSPVLAQFHSHHISGHSNKTVDILSQPSHAASWESIIRLQPTNLHNCRPYFVQCKLLLMLHGCIDSSRIEATLAGKTIAQSIPTPCTLPHGWKAWDTMIGLSIWSVQQMEPCYSRAICMTSPHAQRQGWNHTQPHYKGPHCAISQGSITLATHRAQSRRTHCEPNDTENCSTIPQLNHTSPQMGNAKTKTRAVYPPDVRNIWYTGMDPPTAKFTKPTVTVFSSFRLGTPWPVHWQQGNWILSDIDQMAWSWPNTTRCSSQGTCWGTPHVYQVWFLLSFSDGYDNHHQWGLSQTIQGDRAPNTLSLWQKPDQQLLAKFLMHRTQLSMSCLSRVIDPPASMGLAKKTQHL